MLTMYCYFQQAVLVIYMVNVCDHFGKTWDIRFNPSKSHCITFGGSYCAPNSIIRLGNTELKRVSKLKNISSIILMKGQGHVRSICPTGLASSVVNSTILWQCVDTIEMR